MKTRDAMWGMVLGAALTIGAGCRSAAEGASPPIVEVEVAPERERDVAIAERFAWLVGEWVSEADGRRESETWVVEGEALKGVSESRVGEKVVHSEAIVIERRGDAIVYEARPSSQPAHAFVLVEDGEGRARFEDPAHDWPQAIAYAREGDVLTATVSGVSGGEERTAVWRWTLR